MGDISHTIVTTEMKQILFTGWRGVMAKTWKWPLHHTLHKVLQTQFGVWRWNQPVTRHCGEVDQHPELKPSHKPRWHQNWWGNVLSYWLVYNLCTSCQCLWMIPKSLVLSSLGLFPLAHEGCLKYPVNQTGQSYIKGSYSVMLLWKLASRTCCFNEWPCACMCMLHATICQLRVWRNGVACAKPLSSTRPILCDRRSEILPFPKNPEKDGKSHNGKSGNN